MYLVIHWSGHASDLKGASVYLQGKPEVLNQLRWARWRASDDNGEFASQKVFCPGLQDSIERMFVDREDRPYPWGGFRTGSDVFRDLKDNFLILPGSFLSGWRRVGSGGAVVRRLNLPTDESFDKEGEYYWIELELPPRGDRQALFSGVGVDFGCFIATNRNEQTVYKHTAGNRLVDIELPEEIDNILEITGVTDSHGNDYRPRYDVAAGTVEHTYTLEERGKRLILWFDFSTALAVPPESITVRYAITEGVSANGIEAGRITELYESHPGISDCRNLTEIRGAVPAKTEEQVLTEVSARIRGRDRALTFDDIADWARTFDRRVQSVHCENGVQRSAHGVRRCIVVKVQVAETDFYSDEELQLLRERLGSFLKARSPVNTQYQVEMQAR